MLKITVALIISYSAENVLALTIPAGKTAQNRSGRENSGPPHAYSSTVVSNGFACSDI